MEIPGTRVLVRATQWAVPDLTTGGTDTRAADPTLLRTGAGSAPLATLRASRQRGDADGSRAFIGSR